MFVAPYDDPYTIAGQGTIGNEILRCALHAGLCRRWQWEGGGACCVLQVERPALWHRKPAAAAATARFSRSGTASLLLRRQLRVSHACLGAPSPQANKHGRPRCHLCGDRCGSSGQQHSRRRRQKQHQEHQEQQRWHGRQQRLQQAHQPWQHQLLRPDQTPVTPRLCTPSPPASCQQAAAAWLPALQRTSRRSSRM